MSSDPWGANDPRGHLHSRVWYNLIDAPWLQPLVDKLYGVIGGLQPHSEVVSEQKTGNIRMEVCIS